MSKEKRLEQLSEIAIVTIKEFFSEMEFCGWDAIEEINYDKATEIINIKFQTAQEEYKIEEISGLLSTEIEGFGPCGPSFYEGIELRETELYEEYEGVSEEEKIDYEFIVKHPGITEERKERFKEYAGRLTYVKYRGPEVLKILRAVEKEAIKLSQII